MKNYIPGSSDMTHLTSCVNLIIANEMTAGVDAHSDDPFLGAGTSSDDE